jgi:uncharacterized protein (TIGR02996 family)
MPETAMSTEEGFLDALRKDPFDDMARLIYADWLEERGMCAASICAWRSSWPAWTTMIRA